MIDLSSKNHLLISKSQILHNKGFGVENGHERYIVEMGIVGKSAKKLYYFAILHKVVQPILFEI